MITIRKLGEKYGGIIAEFVSKCDQEGKDCETEEIDSKLLKDLISSLKNNELLTEQQAKYSCSEVLYQNMKTRAIKRLKHFINNEEFIEATELLDIWNVKDEFDCSSNADFLNRKGNIKGVEWILDTFPHYYNPRRDCLFGDAAEFNNVEMVMFLYGKLPREFLEREKNDALEAACDNSNLYLVQWLLSCFEYKQSKIDEIFWISCPHSIELVQFLFYRRGISSECIRKTFRMACEDNHFETAQWLASIQPEIKSNIVLLERVMHLVCYNGRIELARWLYSFYPIINDIERVFESNYLNTNVPMVKWLVYIHPDLLRQKCTKDLLKYDPYLQRKKLGDWIRKKMNLLK